MLLTHWSDCLYFRFDPELGDERDSGLCTETFDLEFKKKQKKAQVDLNRQTVSMFKYI